METKPNIPEIHVPKEAKKTWVKPSLEVIGKDIIKGGTGGSSESNTAGS